MNGRMQVEAGPSATIAEVIGEVAREIRVRDSVYPRLVLQGRLTQGEADRRMRALRVGLWYLEREAKAQRPAHATTMG